MTIEMPADEYPPPAEGKCNTKTTKAGRPSRCGLRAGAGTDHVGAGGCRHHGGLAPNHRKAAALAQFERRFATRVRFGAIIATDPMVGLLDEVSRSAGFVAYIEQQIRQADGTVPDGTLPLTERSASGDMRVSILIDLWRKERAHLAQVCRMALDAGVQEKQLDLITSYQTRVLDLIENVVRGLGRDPDDPAVDAVVRAEFARIVAATSSPMVAPRFDNPLGTGWSGDGDEGDR